MSLRRSEASEAILTNIQHEIASQLALAMTFYKGVFYVYNDRGKS